MAFSGLHSLTARISFFATGDGYSLRSAIRYIPKMSLTSNPKSVIHPTICVNVPQIQPLSLIYSKQFSYIES
jgi:hypothetical protein